MKNNSQAEITEAFNRGITSGVYIITVKAGEKINGMTAAWVSKLSRKPPMVTVSISPKNYTHQLMHSARYFAINTLAEGQQPLGKHFGFTSGRDVDKLSGVEFFEGETGAPVLREAMSYLECELSDTFITGDHTLFIGKVIIGKVFDTNKTPLVFKRNDFF